MNIRSILLKITSLINNPNIIFKLSLKDNTDFDIIGKSIFILCSKGAEYNNLVKTVRDRAKATSDFTKTDLSVVMNILLGEE